MLTHGITLGNTEVRIVMLKHWDVGTLRDFCCVAPIETQMISLGYFAVLVDRRFGPAPDPQVMRLLHEWAAKRTATSPRPPARRVHPLKHGTILTL
jgi:hypothetical protein